MRDVQAQDLLLRGGLVVDGTGRDAFVGDVLISDGKIAAVGRGSLSVSADAPGGARVVDASGKIVAPCWVDVHTHLDAQIMWDPCTSRLPPPARFASVSLKLLRSVHIDVRCADVSPVATNGIGTFVMGNCGCAFAPCDRGDRNFLIELMVSGCAKASS